MRIVVVEDEPAIADFLVRGLEAAGYSVALATDGRSGEKLILEGEADLVVLDLMLPERNGFEVLAAVRKVRPLLPVIILSAKGEVEDRIAGLDSGATDYVTKPFSVPELLARIRAQLRTGDRRGRPAAGRRRSRSTCSAAESGRAVRRSRCRHGSSRCSPASPAIPARPSRGIGCWPRPGATNTTPAPTSSTSTSATCAASSATRRRSRRSDRPATGSSTAAADEPADPPDGGDRGARGRLDRGRRRHRLQPRRQPPRRSHRPGPDRPGRRPRRPDRSRTPGPRGGGGAVLHRRPGAGRLATADRAGAGRAAADQQPVGRCSSSRRGAPTTATTAARSSPSRTSSAPCSTPGRGSRASTSPVAASCGC